MELVPSFGLLLQGLSVTMTAPTFASLTTLLTGWLFAGRRTVTRIILRAGDAAPKHFSSYHRLFSAARWSLDAVGLAVFDLISPWLDSIIALALDDTLARKRGLKVFGAGMHHDPLLSTRKTAVMNWGHSWVMLGVLVKFPFRADRYFCLPILCRLYLNREAAVRARRAYRTRPELAAQMLGLLCQHRKSQRFHVVADSLYGGKSVLLQLPANCDLTSRLHLDARLYDRPPVRMPGNPGRPRKRGTRRATPRQMLHRRCRHATLNLYGRHDRVRLADAQAVWHAAADRTLRIVAVQPLTGGRSVQAFYSTWANATAEQVLACYAQRWAIEQTFQETKSHLGFEQPQGWSRRAVERTAPVAMLLYSLIVLWFADHGHRHWQAPAHPWYRSKRSPTFADMLDSLRHETLRKTVSTWGLRGTGSRKIIRALQQVASLAA